MLDFGRYGPTPSKRKEPTMKLGACLFTLLILTTLSCGDKDEGALGEQAAGVVSDSRVLQEAQDAANQIIRNQTDCEAVKANLADVNRKLDEAAGKVKTSTGRTTLETLKKQVKTIAEACGAM
jgi:hypothetical protein